MGSNDMGVGGLADSGAEGLEIRLHYLIILATHHPLLQQLH